MLTATQPVDVVAEYAPDLATICVEQTPPVILIFCRRISFMYNGMCHRVLRSITFDTDLPFYGITR